MTSPRNGIIARAFSGRAAPPDGSEHPALRAFSLERVMGYGVDHADAVELRGRVAGGEDWQAVALDLADTGLSPPEGAVSPQTEATRINRLYRASALLRVSQVLMAADDDRRRGIFARAADLFAEAIALSGDGERVAVHTEQGVLAGWYYPAGAEPAAVGSAVVIGGIEGWAMDFSAQGLELARRGVATLMLDGPGQGESRMAHGHYLSRSWMASYGEVLDYVIARNQGAPLAFVGNSMGGVVAMRLAAQDARIAAVCENGAPRGGGGGPPNPIFAQKVKAHCGDVADEEAGAIWATLRPGLHDAPVSCPLLIVHGGRDPMVSAEAAQGWFDSATSADKQIVTFSDGDHCVYNHPEDVRNLIADWVADRLKANAR